MRFVDVFVDDGDVQPSVYPIDTIIGEQEVPSRGVNVAQYLKNGRKLTVPQMRIDKSSHRCQLRHTAWSIPSLLLGTKVMSTTSSQGMPADSFEFLSELGFWGISDVASYHGWRCIWMTIRRRGNKVYEFRWVWWGIATEADGERNPVAKMIRMVEIWSRYILRQSHGMIAADVVDARRVVTMSMMKTWEEEI